jgi:hypothetical protein
MIERAINMVVSKMHVQRPRQSVTHPIAGVQRRRAARICFTAADKFDRQHRLSPVAQFQLSERENILSFRNPQVR